MKMKRAIAAATIGIILCLQTACGTPFGLQSANQAAVDEKTVLAEFDRLTTLDSINLKDIASFIESNIKYSSPENASAMIMKLEALQKENLSTLEQEFFTNIIQEKFQKEQDPNLMMDLKDSELKTLVGKTRESGYKVEMAEGMYFPVLDYTFYATFLPYAAEDMVAYVQIMAVESESPSAKDGALIIHWEELLKRALDAEQFLIQYPHSQKNLEMEKVFKRYQRFLFFGANNTPLFDYDTQKMNSAAQKALESALEQKGAESRLMTQLQQFMEGAKANEYRLTQGLEDIRNKIMKG